MPFFKDVGRIAGTIGKVAVGTVGKAYGIDTSQFFKSSNVLAPGVPLIGSAPVIGQSIAGVPSGVGAGIPTAVTTVTEEKKTIGFLPIVLIIAVIYFITKKQ